jgi:hypothetical protein
MSQADPVSEGTVMAEEIIGDMRYRIQKYEDGDVRVFQRRLDLKVEEEVAVHSVPSRIRRLVTEARNLVAIHTLAE